MIKNILCQILKKAGKEKNDTEKGSIRKPQRIRVETISNFLIIIFIILLYNIYNVTYYMLYIYYIIIININGLDSEIKRQNCQNKSKDTNCINNNQKNN